MVNCEALRRGGGSGGSIAVVAAFAILASFVTAAVAQPSKRLASLRSPDQYLNMCMLGQSHKPLPSAEPTLHGQCQPYQGKACCSASTAGDLHTNETWYRLRREHCGPAKMSDECKRHFDMDLCFYECSPDIGPWLTEDARRWRQEKMRGVPLCSSQCERWFSSCANDYTCADNWYTGFQWKDGQNLCTRNCSTFQDVFKNAKAFCENIWDGSYVVVDDQQSCMSFPAVESETQRNTEAARQRAKELLWQQQVADGNSGATSVPERSFLLAVVTWLTTFCLLPLVLSRVA